MDLGEAGRDDLFGHGRVDAQQALARLDWTPPPVPRLESPPYLGVVAGPVEFDWSDVDDSQGVRYDLQVSYYSWAWDAPYLVVDARGLKGSSHRVESLPRVGAVGWTYAWRVQALDCAGNAVGWTEPGLFTYLGP